MEGKVKKVLLVGDQDCGKKNLATTLANDESLEPMEEMPMAFKDTDIYIDVDGKRNVLRLYTISGLEEQELSYERRHFYSIISDVDIVLMCFAVNNSMSLVDVETKWLREVKQYFPNAPILLVGNKTDTRTGKTPEDHYGPVDYAGGKTLEDHSGSDDYAGGKTSEDHSGPVDYAGGCAAAVRLNAYGYVECSALENDCVKDVFTIGTFAALEREIICKQYPALS